MANVRIVTSKPLTEVRKRYQDLFNEISHPVRLVSQKVRPQFEKVLKSRCLEQLDSKYPGNKSLSSGLRIEPGGSGAGRPAISIRMTGKAADYGKILNKGGTIKPRRWKHLTVPIGPLTRDARGHRIKSPWDIEREIQGDPNKSIITFNSKRSGKRIMALKEKPTKVRSALRRFGRKIPFLGRAVKKPNEAKITPLFWLAKQVTIKGSFWADKAYNSALSQLRFTIQNEVRKEISRHVGQQK